MAPTKKKLTKPYPVRLSPHLLESLKKAKEKSGELNESEILRASAQIGLAILAELEHDIPGALAKMYVKQHGGAAAVLAAVAKVLEE